MQLSEAAMTKSDQFRTMCEQHDLTYEYSDDGRAYRRGRDSEDAIRKFVSDGNITNEEAAEIWNSVVAERLVPDARGQFEWRRV